MNIEYLTPENVKGRSKIESLKYIDGLNANLKTKLNPEMSEILDNAFKAGYKTAFIDMLQKSTKK